MPAFNRDDYPVRSSTGVSKPSQDRVRRASASEWEQSNIVLDDGEPGYATDTKVYKIGDGKTAWNDLATVAGGGASSGGLEMLDAGEAYLAPGENTIALSLSRSFEDPSAPLVREVYFGGNAAEDNGDGTFTLTTSGLWILGGYFSFNRNAAGVSAGYNSAGVGIQMLLPSGITAFPPAHTIYNMNTAKNYTNFETRVAVLKAGTVFRVSETPSMAEGENYYFSFDATRLIAS